MRSHVADARPARWLLGPALAAALLAGALGVSGTATAQPATARPATAPASGAAAGAAGAWEGTWTASPQRPNLLFEPTWANQGFERQTVRQVVRVSAGGSRLRIRLTNPYGTRPLRLAGATVARAGEGAAVQPGSLRRLKFHGSRSVAVPVGGSVTSDAVGLRTAPLQRLAVTMFFAEPTGPATFHALASATSFRAAGDRLDDLGGGAFTETNASWFYLEAVETWRARPRGDGIVAFGDSITDGAGSTVDADNRYPDQLAERLVAAGRPRAVLNAGIIANRVLTDSPCFGDRAVQRFRPDALGQRGVRTAIVLEGINDIIFPDVPGEAHPCFSKVVVDAEQLIAGHRELIRQAHRRGVRVVGATLLPYKGAPFFTDRGEAIRDELNHWIRTSGAYDAVVDFERATADPADPDRLNPAFDSGDHIHPNDTGYAAMTAAIDLTKL